MTVHDIFLWIAVFKTVLIVLFSLKFRWVNFFSRKKEKYTPPISVIVPAFNEELCLRKTLDSILSNPYMKNTQSEVIVLDDGSTDSTESICEDYSGKYNNVFAILKDNSGKAETLNEGIAFSRHDIIMCVDADSTLDRGAIVYGIRHFIDEKVGAVSGVVYPSRILSLLEIFQYIEYSFGQAVEKQFQSSLGSLLVIPGAIGFFRKSAIQKIGGYKTDTLTEDFDLTLELQKHGWDVVLDNRAVSYTEVPNTLFSLIKQRIRWTCGTLQTIIKNKDLLFNGTTLGNIGLPYAIVFGIMLAFISPFILFYFVLFHTNLFLVWCTVEICLQFYSKSDVYAVFAPFQRLFQALINFYVVWVSLLTFQKNKSWNKLARRGV